jgi:hypothetical protein
MGTTECLDCKKEINDDVENCPHCGALRKRFPGIKKMGSTPKPIPAENLPQIDSEQDIASQKAVSIPARNPSTEDTHPTETAPSALKPLMSAPQTLPPTESDATPQKSSLKSLMAETTTSEEVEEKKSTLKALMPDNAQTPEVEEKKSTLKSLMPNTNPTPEPEEKKSALKALATSPVIPGQEETSTQETNETPSESTPHDPPPPVTIAFAPTPDTQKTQTPETPAPKKKKAPIGIILAAIIILGLVGGIFSVLNGEKETEVVEAPAPTPPAPKPEPIIEIESLVTEPIKIFKDIDLGPVSQDVLSKLNMGSIPQQLTPNEIQAQATAQADQEFSEEFKNGVITQFNQENPIIKQGDEITYNTSGVSINGMFKGTSADRALIDYTSYDLEDLPLKLQIGLLPKVRTLHMNKFIHNNFELPRQSKIDSLTKQISKSYPYQLYTNELTKKARHLIEPPFDRVYSLLKNLKGEEQKKHADAIINYYYQYENFLENRKDQANKVLTFAYQYDSKGLLKQLQKVISLKRSFKAEAQENTSDSLVTIQGDHSTGTGFFINYFGLKCVIANRHLFIGNRKFSLIDSKNQVIEVKGYALGKMSEPSRNSDIIIIGLNSEAQEKYTFIPISESLRTNATVELVSDQNNEQASILHTSSRTFVLTPDLNSTANGKPITFQGKAIGLATYIKPKLHSWSPSGTGSSEPQSYAVKISAMTIRDYELLNLNQYYQNLEVIEKLELANKDFIAATKRDYGMPAERVISKNSQLVSRLRIESAKLNNSKIITHLKERSKRATKISQDITHTIDQVINGTYGNRPFN